MHFYAYFPLWLYFLLNLGYFNIFHIWYYTLIMVDKNIFFKEITFIVTGQLDIKKILSQGREYIDKFIPVDSLFLELYNTKEGSAKVYAYADRNKAEILNKVIHIPEELRSSLKPNPEDINSVMIINNTDEHPIAGIITSALNHNGTSALAIPLYIEDTLLGALIIEKYGYDAFSNEHAELAKLLIKPFSISLHNCIKHDEVKRLSEIIISDKKYLENEILNLSGSKIIGADYGLKGVMEKVKQVSKTDAPVLLLGETGVGKDVIANAIHYSSRRSENPFIKVNSGAISENLIDSELFGHEKGSFTGAITEKRGRFERANNGSLFLDEIGELPLNAQIRLLRVIQNRELERVGGVESIPVDVRIIAATHRDLEDMIDNGEFREDLWFRLNVFPIIIPPLRERKEDIPSLVNYFLQKKTVDLGIKDIPTMNSNSLNNLIEYPWPGNVRELENIIERALITHIEGPLLIDPYAGSGRRSSKASPQEIVTLDEYTSDYIRYVLDKCDGVIHGDKGAAKLLGVKPTTLRYKMDKLGIKYKKRLQ